MAIKDTNSPVYATVTNEVKEKLIELAQKNHRSLSQEVAYALDEYLRRHYRPAGDDPPQTKQST